MKNAFPENIEGHSLQVAMISHALAVIKNEFFDGEVDAEKIALYAMYHDANEILTGDLPTPVKYYNPDIRDAYKKVEDISKEKLISMLPEKLREYYREIFFFENKGKECYYIVKAADRISAYIKCIEELKVGNMEFKEAAEAVRKSIEKMEYPEVAYFMEKFIPGFELTLDRSLT